MDSPRIVSHIAADHPMLFSEPLRPTAVARTGLRCRAFAQQTFNYRLARGLLSSDSFGNLHMY
jgi:hypothetical protein